MTEYQGEEPENYADGPGDEEPFQLDGGASEGDETEGGAADEPEEEDDAVIQELLEAGLNIGLLLPRPEDALDDLFSEVERAGHDHRAKLVGPAPQVPDDLLQRAREALAERFGLRRPEHIDWLIEHLSTHHADQYPWTRTLDALFARRALKRVIAGVDRQRALNPVTAPRPVPPKAAGYVREVVDAYLFGCDTACIVLCRATFEQVAREVLVKRGVFTRPQLDRERPTAGKLLAELKRAGLSELGYDRASALVRRADTSLHQGQWEATIRPQMARDSIDDLVFVLVELEPRW